MGQSWSVEYLELVLDCADVCLAFVDLLVISVGLQFGVELHVSDVLFGIWLHPQSEEKPE